MYSKAPVDERPVTPPFVFSAPEDSACIKNACKRIIGTDSRQTLPEGGNGSPLPSSLVLHIELVELCKDRFT